MNILAFSVYTLCSNKCTLYKIVYLLNFLLYCFTFLQFHKYSSINDDFKHLIESGSEHISEDSPV